MHEARGMKSVGLLCLLASTKIDVSYHQAPI